MRMLIIVLAVMVGLLAVVPLAVLIVVWAAQGFMAAAAWAAIYLLLWSILLTLVPLAVLAVAVVKGAPFALGKMGSFFGRFRRLAERLDGLVARASGVAVRPDIWLYSKAAWLSGYLHGVQR